MLYDRFTRLLHLFLAIGIVAELGFSLVMVYPKPGRQGDVFYALHEIWGQVSLGVLLIHWIWCMTRTGPVAFSLLFPWFSRSRYRAIQEDIQRYAVQAARFRLPDSAQASPLASAVQGLGLSVATLLGGSGLCLFFAMDAQGAMTDWAHAVKDAHEVLGSLMWLYLAVHVSMGILHQWAGHGSLRAMVWVWEKNPQPTTDNG